MRLVLTPCALTLIAAAHIAASAAAADELAPVDSRDRQVPMTLRTIHMRELAAREEPAPDPNTRPSWLEHFGTTKGGFKYQDNFVVGERKMKWSVKGPFLREQQPGLTFEVKF